MNNGSIIDYVKNGEYRGTVGADLNLGQRLETLGTINAAFTIEISNVFMIGINCDTAYLQCVIAHRRIGQQ